MKDSTKFTLSLLGGVAVGAALGLLFAPKPGEETREDVKRWLGEKADQSKEILARGKETFSAKKEHIGAALKAGKKAYSEAVQTYKETYKEPANV